MENISCTRVLADWEQIQNCRTRIYAAQQSFANLSSTLALAGNEVRLKILYLLQEEKELCPCDLADILGMSIPAISQHLRKLKDGDIVISRKSGQTIYYSLAKVNMEIIEPFFTHLNFQTHQLQNV